MFDVADSDLDVFELRRGGTNAMAERSDTPIGTVKGVLVTNWGNGFGISFRGRKGRRDTDETAPHSAELYVRRGVTDLRNRDRLTRADGQTYRVVGDSMWDRDHALSGSSFSWKVYQVESLNG